MKKMIFLTKFHFHIQILSISRFYTGFFQTKDWLPDGTRNLKSYKQTRIIIQRPNRKRQKIKLIEVYFDVMRQCHSLAPIPRCDKRYSEDTCVADDLIDEVSGLCWRVVLFEWD